jgi:hypothetical protein
VETAPLAQEAIWDPSLGQPEQVRGIHANRFILYAHTCAYLGFYDATYKDYDGENAVRILNPCSAGDPESACTWYDNSTKLMKRRWYSTAEPLGNGTIVILGGFVNGGYINRYEPRGHVVPAP